MSDSSRRQKFGWLWLVFPLVSAAFLHLGPVLAQQPAAAPNYKQLDAPQPDKAKTKVYTDMFVSDQEPGKIPAGGLPVIQEMLAFQLSEFTQLHIINSGPSGVTQKRNLMRQKIIQASRLPNKELHRTHNLTVIELGMPIVLDKEIHPLARYNVLYLIGSLDRQEREGATPPIPLTEGTIKLLEVLNNAELPAYLHVAAAEQLARHSEFDMAPKQRADVIAAVKRYLVETSPPDKYDPAGWTWLRKRATNIVRNFVEKKHAEANDPQLVQALIRLLADPKASLNDRCEALAALRSYDPKAFAPTQFKEIVLAGGDTLKTAMQTCSDPAKSRPLVSHAMHFVSAVGESFCFKDTNDVEHGMCTITNVPADVRLAMRGIGRSCSECLKKLGPTATARVDGPQQTIMQQFLAEIEGILSPLGGGSPVANATGT